MRSISSVRVALALLVVLAAAPSAFAQQAVSVSFGAFALRGEDGRVDGDTLVENRDLFVFDFGDFTAASINGEYLVPIGNFLEASAGIGFSRKTVPTIYDDYVRPNGDEIEQELRLRVVPITGTVRVLPLGREAPVQPYVGGGIAILNWNYSETGDFIDFSTPAQTIFPATYEASGTEVGPVAVFGLRVPLEQFAVGAEVRYQRANADLNEDFLGPKLDLGGWHYLGTFAFRF